MGDYNKLIIFVNITKINEYLQKIYVSNKKNIQLKYIFTKYYSLLVNLASFFDALIAFFFFLSS